MGCFLLWKMTYHPPRPLLCPENGSPPLKGSLGTPESHRFLSHTVTGFCSRLDWGSVVTQRGTGHLIVSRLPGDSGGQMLVSTKDSEYGKGQEVRMGKGQPKFGEATREQARYSCTDPGIYQALPECPAPTGHMRCVATEGRALGGLGR